MAFIGLANIFYGLFLFIFYIVHPIKDIILTNDTINLTESKINQTHDYKRFYNTIEIP